MRFIATLAICCTLSFGMGCSIPLKTVQLKCRHSAIVSALAMSEEGYPVMLDRGITDDGGFHVQARAMIDGRWIYLASDRSFVYPTFQDNYTITESVSMLEYILRTWVFR